MQKFRNITLTITNVVSFVGIFYYFIPGFNHVGTVGIGSQPNMGFLCIIMFLVAFLTAAQLAPKKQQETINIQKRKEQISPYTGENYDPEWGIKMRRTHR